MELNRAIQALQAQFTYRGDGLEVGVKAHKKSVVMQGHSSNQKIDAEHSAADLATGLA